MKTKLKTTCQKTKNDQNSRQKAILKTEQHKPNKKNKNESGSEVL